MGRRAAVILALAALSITGAGAQQPAASSRDISGFWALTADGKKVPDAKLLPRVTRGMLDLHKRRDVHALRWCNPVGLPLMMDSGTPIEIRQGPTSLIVLAENSLVPRYMYLNRKHVSADIYDPSTIGDSVATWEGDTLVVDTIGVDAKNTWVDNFRTPHSDQLHVVERFHIVNGGKTLQVDLHVEDPGAYTMAWNAVQRYDQADQEFVEAVCAENNPLHLGQLDPLPEAKTPDF